MFLKKTFMKKLKILILVSDSSHESLLIILIRFFASLGLAP